MAGEWFFSTLAQVTAAIVGFIIAITMITYSLEKERRMNRIAEFRDLLNEFQSYSIPFDQIQAHLSRSDANSVDEYLFNNYGEENIKDEMFTEDFVNHPVPVRFYGLSLHIATTLFHDLRPWKRKVPGLKTIESVGLAAWDLDKLLSEDESACLVYDSLTNSNNTPENFMEMQVFDSPIKWNEREIKSLEDVRELSSEMLKDYHKIRDRFPSVYSNHATNVYDVLNISVYLVLIGSFLPLLIMFTPPEPIQYAWSVNSIFIFQIFLLLGSSILTFTLIDLVRVLIRSGVTESYQPKWITRRLVRYLPSII